MAQGTRGKGGHTAPLLPPAHMDNLTLRRRVWFVRVRVPKPLVAIMGCSVLIKTTGQRDPLLALITSKPIVAAFKAQIAAARGMAQAVPVRPPEIVKAQPSGLTKLATRLTGFLVPKVPEPEPSHALVDAWGAHLTTEGIKARQVSQMVADAALMPKHDLRASPWTPATAEAWVAKRLAEGDAAATVSRRLSALRNYGGYLKAQQGHSDLLVALQAAKVPKASKAARALQVHRGAFTWSEITDLWEATETPSRAGGSPDHALKDLIALAAFTGARIEELCQTTVAMVQDLNGPVPSIKVSSKTEAGRRVIPLVPRAQVLVSRLVTTAAQQPVGSQWLIPSTSSNQYGERSVALGKRFGRLKASKGHGEDLVFHSIRKAMATALQNTGCPEPIAADILGHEINTMSYGVYSAGSSGAVRLQWLVLATSGLGIMKGPGEAV